ncbi:MAG: ATP-binding protein [Aminipila sp.]
MEMEITRGILGGAQKIVVYGPEGIGKSTFAACFPYPLFIDTEGSTKNLNVARTPRPSSFTMIMEQIKHVKQHPELCRTLVIDTADWAEQLCLTEICAKYSKKGIEDFGYGKGYVYLAEDFGRFLNLLEDLIDVGINVVINAHASMRKFEQPDETGAYDRWELKLKKQTAPLLKEWADMILFANYKTLVIKDENDKAKARGGKRVMYTTHHPCWDAKNRHGLPDETPFEYQQIAACIPGSSPAAKAVIEQPKVDMKPTEPVPDPPKENNIPESQPVITKVEGPMKALQDLMTANKVTEADIQLAVSQKGYYPKATPIDKYEPDFIAGVLIGAWPQVFGMIKKNWNEETPF